MKMRMGMFFTFLLMLSAAAPRSWAADQKALHVVENLQATLLTVMKEGEKIGYGERYERLRPVLEASFDFPFISGVILGGHWKNLSREQSTRFVDTFTRLSIATYAANFDRYSGERFNIVSARETRAGRFLVETGLIRSAGDEVRLDYILHKAEDGWRIINVVANGVSDLALKRADYTAFLEKNGFEALIQTLNEKIAHSSR